MQFFYTFAIVCALWGISDAVRGASIRIVAAIKEKTCK